MSDTFDDIKVGEVVALRSWDGWRHRTRKADVTRVMPSTFECGGSRFRKSDGRGTPQLRYSDHALRLSAEVEQQMRDEQEERDYFRSLAEVRGVTWSGVDRETVAAVHALLVTAGVIQPTS